MGKQESFAAFMAWVAAAPTMLGIPATITAGSIIANVHAITVFQAASIGLGASIAVTASGRIF